LAVSKSDKAESLRRPNIRLEVAPAAGGFLVTVGPVSLLLDRTAAEELMCLLADALEPGDPLDLVATGRN
jgi:hypothetical protein